VCNTFTQKLDDMLNNGAIITQNICSIRDLVSATCQQTQPIHDLHSSVVTQISRSDEKRPINFSTGRYLTSNNLSLTAVHQWQRNWVTVDITSDRRLQIRYMGRLSDSAPPQIDFASRSPKDTAGIVSIATGNAGLQTTYFILSKPH